MAYLFSSLSLFIRLRIHPVIEMTASCPTANIVVNVVNNNCAVCINNVISNTIIVITSVPEIVLHWKFLISQRSMYKYRFHVILCYRCLYYYYYYASYTDVFTRIIVYIIFSFNPVHCRCVKSKYKV